MPASYKVLKEYYNLHYKLSIFYYLQFFNILFLKIMQNFKTFL